MALEIITKNSRQTQKVAGLLARHLSFKCASRVAHLRKAIILALQGDLGAGKTTFIQGFARGLGIKEKILSPTFVILKRFNIPRLSLRGGQRPTKQSQKRLLRSARNDSVSEIWPKYLYHLDCYRIDSPQEIIDLGFKEIAANPQNIVIIEWAERIKKILPKYATWLKFEWIDKNKRTITLMTND